MKMCQLEEGMAERKYDRGICNHECCVELNLKIRYFLFQKNEGKPNEVTGSAFSLHA